MGPRSQRRRGWPSEVDGKGVLRECLSQRNGEGFLSGWPDGTGGQVGMDVTPISASWAVGARGGAGLSWRVAPPRAR